jgi:hypothetical protein
MFFKINVCAEPAEPADKPADNLIVISEIKGNI